MNSRLSGIGFRRSGSDRIFPGAMDARGDKSDRRKFRQEHVPIFHTKPDASLAMIATRKIFPFGWNEIAMRDSIENLNG